MNSSSDLADALAAWLHAHKLKGFLVWKCGNCGTYRQRMTQRCSCQVDCGYDPGAYSVTAEEIARELDAAEHERIEAASAHAIEQRIDERRVEAEQ